LWPGSGDFLRLPHIQRAAAFCAASDGESLPQGTYAAGSVIAGAQKQRPELAEGTQGEDQRLPSFHSCFERRLGAALPFLRSILAWRWVIGALLSIRDNGAGLSGDAPALSSGHGIDRGTVRQIWGEAKWRGLSCASMRTT
jgi:hypothetical protein